MPKLVVGPVGERVALNMKTSPEMRAILEEAARKSGRSLTAEVEARVRQSFEWEQSFGDVRTYVAAKMAEVDALAQKQLEADQRLARQKQLGGGWQDPTTEKPEHAFMTADDVRKIVAEMLAEHEAQKETPRKRA